MAPRTFLPLFRRALRGAGRKPLRGRRWRALRGASSRAVALLFPARCPGCDRALPPGAPPDDVRRCWCEVCQVGLEPGGRFALPGLAGAHAALLYGGPSRDAILRLKHGGRRDLAAPLATHLLLVWTALAASHIGASGEDGREPSALRGPAPVWVPVPLHPARLRRRGYNQSLELLRALRGRAAAAGHARAEILPDTLVRVRDTPPLGRLSPAARREVVAGAFRVRDAGRVTGRVVLLADDVVTSGATLVECARTLRAAGAAAVLALVLARAG